MEEDDTVTSDTPFILSRFVPVPPERLDFALHQQLILWPTDVTFSHLPGSRGVILWRRRASHLPVHRILALQRAANGLFVSKLNIRKTHLTCSVLTHVPKARFHGLPRSQTTARPSPNIGRLWGVVRVGTRVGGRRHGGDRAYVNRGADGKRGSSDDVVFVACSGNEAPVSQSRMSFHRDPKRRGACADGNSPKSLHVLF